MKKFVKFGILFLLLSVFVSCSDIMEMVKRDLQIESQRAAADSRNNPY
ncbi:ATP F0F1 synthase subunit B [Fusobacterium nucleatum]|uniref:ATP F0F1 synthase subunit B n=1 Tax=Fusobacterium nucleatum subsp. polymorphum TaxID=76857 RepID=A0A2C6AXL4_FUSNP|nr:ATP F0F1 synthase subunit B [Fusobacterium polymorphum]